MSAGERVVAVSASPASVRWTGIAALITPEPWVQDALCAETDPDLFHPEQGGTAMPAKSVCARCPVIDECLEYALRTGQPESVWGREVRAGAQGDESRSSGMTTNIIDPADEYWTGCTEDCADGCEADHRGEQ